eukprot:g443.t1
MIQCDCWLLDPICDNVESEDDPRAIERSVLIETYGERLLTLGRSERASVRVVGSSISRLHCTIKIHSRRMFIADGSIDSLGKIGGQSRLGTFINGKRLPSGGVFEALVAYDILSLGSVAFCVRPVRRNSLTENRIRGQKLAKEFQNMLALFDTAEGPLRGFTEQTLEDLLGKLSSTCQPQSLTTTS